MIKFLKHNWVKLLSIPVILAITIMTVMFAFPAAADDIDELVVSVTDVVITSWDTASENIQALVNAYYNAFKSVGSTRFFSSVSDIPKTWLKVVSDGALQGVYVLETVDDLYYYLDPLTNKLTAYTGYHYSGGGGHHYSGSTGGGGGRNRWTVSDGEEMYLSADDFQSVINRLSQQYGPKNTSNRHSWQTDKAYLTHLSFFSEGTFFNSGLSEVYCVPFFYNGKTKDTYYYSLCQLHFYQQVTQDEDGNNVVSLYMDYYNWFDGGETTTSLVSEDLSTIRYMRFPDITCAQLTFRGFTKYSDFLSYTNGSYMSVAGVDIGTSYDLSDLSLNTSIQWASTLPWAIRYTTNSAAEIAAQDYADYGFFYSSAPINMGAYDIDWDKMPDDYSVVASGDTIYDYDIIDNTTGDTTTINNYINNNYNYPDNDNGSGGNGGNNSGGQTSGNVTVSGDINVGGKVEVDVNVNINHEDNSGGNGGSSGAGESENPSDYIDPGTVEGDISEYLKQVPEISSNVINWLKGMISWLPKEIYGLIILGLVVAIFCRLNGR